MIRVAIVDDHPAIRVGLETAVHSEWGLVSVGTADQAEDVPALLYSTQPDVVLLDYRLPRHDGLSVCLTIKADAPAPAVLPSRRRYGLPGGTPGAEVGHDSTREPSQRPDVRVAPV